MAWLGFHPEHDSDYDSLTACFANLAEQIGAADDMHEVLTSSTSINFARYGSTEATEAFQEYSREGWESFIAANEGFASVGAK